MTNRILIVEDEAFLVSLYKINFENKGLDLRFASNGAEALKMIDDFEPDLVLLDLVMPDMDGFEFIEHARKAGCKFPIIVITSLAQDVDERKCIELGAQECLVKSEIEIRDLWKRIEGYLKKERKKDDAQATDGLAPAEGDGGAVSD